MLRPGRLDKLVYVDVPGAEGREAILRAQTRKLMLADDVDLAAVSADANTTGYTGADLAALVREAGTLALRRLSRQADGVITNAIVPRICAQDMADALGKVAPSVSPADLRRYRAMRRKLNGSRGAIPSQAQALPSPLGLPSTPEASELG